MFLRGQSIVNKWGIISQTKRQKLRMLIEALQDCTLQRVEEDIPTEDIPEEFLVRIAQLLLLLLLS
jgi:hypothetical protein